MAEQAWNVSQPVAAEQSDQQPNHLAVYTVAI